MPERNYKFPDEVLIQKGSTTVGHLVDDQFDFEAFDQDLNTDHRNDLSILVDQALNEGGDEVNVYGLGNKTERVLEELDKCRTLTVQMKYWVLKAFPNKKSIQRLFGVGVRSKIFKSQEKTIQFISSLKNHVAEYRPQLEAAGAPASLLDSVATQATDLKVANDEQEKMKGTRTVETEGRVELLNNLHQMLQAYNAAAEIIYIDNPAKRDLYRLPSQYAVEDEEEIESIEE